MCTGAGRAVSVYSELIADGVSRRWVQAATRRGALRQIRRGVYATFGACEPALTAALHGGAIACITAARHAGLWVLSEDDSVHVWLRGGGHERRHAEKGCTCVPHWDGAARGDSFGPPTTAGILRQILACAGVEEFFVALESALRKGMLHQADLDWLCLHTNESGREALALARADADSGLESLVRWRLRRHNLAVRTQVVIPSTGRVDLLIGERLIVEADGRENHHDAEHRHKDLVRDAHAAMWGYVTLRFDYAMIVHDWDLVERAILSHSARLGAS